jgi:hypothetical protein
MKPKPLPLAIDRVWPRCENDGCDRPAKPSFRGNPRTKCSACLKRAETAKNSAKTCDAPGCDLNRAAAYALCKWHYSHGRDAVMSEATKALSLKRREAWKKGLAA